MYKDLIFKNDSLTTPTDMYEAMDAWKKENAITDKDDFTWFYDDRETEEKDSPASIDIQVQMGRWFELYTQLHDGDNLTIENNLNEIIKTTIETEQLSIINEEYKNIFSNIIIIKSEKLIEKNEGNYYAYSDKKITIFV
jgi:hypothetical protein